MKKTLFIVAAVVGYSLFETGMFLGVLTRPFSDWGTERHYEVLALSAQVFFLVPGIAVLFSGVIYGRYQWHRRALLILLVASLPAPTLIAIAVAAGALVDPTLSVSSPAILAALLLFLLGGIVWAIFFAVRTAIRRGVELETRRWLSDLRSGFGPERRKWRNRGLRIAVCIPTITVLLVFLFLPETWGILSHFAQRRVGSLPGYQVPIPTTWIIFQSSHHLVDGESFSSGLAGRGMAKGIKPYLDVDLPLSGWSIGTERYRQPGQESGKPTTHGFRSNQDQIVDRREFSIANEHLTCVEYRPSYLKRAHYSVDPSIVFIDCIGSGRLYAGMTGKRDFLPAFYKMINGISAIK